MILVHRISDFSAFKIVTLSNQTHLLCISSFGAIGSGSGTVDCRLSHEEAPDATSLYTEITAHGYVNSSRVAER